MEKRKLKNNWSPYTWKKFDILQQPNWPDKVEYKKIIQKLKSSPPLTLYDEIINLKQRLIKVEHGDAFLLQGGDCAETFKEFSEQNIKNKLKILFQMSTIITYKSSMDVLKIGRIAGQYAKPRTSNIENRNGVSLPSYRGDSINKIAFNLSARTPNPKRLLKAYQLSLSTLNLVKSLVNSELEDFALWDNSNSGIYKRFEKTIYRIKKSLNFLNAMGQKINLFKIHRFNEFYTSHESLILDYESALTKNISKKIFYNASAHMVWLGDRTRSINSAHVEYLSGLINPIGIKCGPNIGCEDLKWIIQKINPLNEMGKIILICRFGVNYIKKELPLLIKMIKKNSLNVIWACDPMHGNTYQSNTNYKTRNFKTITKELKEFFKIHYDFGTQARGVHFELTPNNVTECLGGIRNIKESDLHINYETACDPRLNHEQSIELAFLISTLINKYYVPRKNKL